MADDPKKRGKPDRDRIHIHQYYERIGWCKKFGINATRLRDAVEAVGPMVKDVKAWLIKQIQEA